MLTNNKENLSKSKVVSAIQKNKNNSFQVYDLNSPSELKVLTKDIENSMKKGSVSIVLIEG